MLIANTIRSHGAKLAPQTALIRKTLPLKPTVGGRPVRLTRKITIAIEMIGALKPMPFKLSMRSEPVTPSK